MGSVIGEEKQVENGDCSLLRSLPIYKRRKISAVRDFPDGCGPCAAQNNMRMKEMGADGQKEGDVPKDLENSGEKGRDLCEVEGKESQRRDITVYQNRDQLVISNSVNNDKVEHENEELLKLPVENHKSPQDLDLQKNDDESPSKDEICDTSKDLMEVRVESPSALKDTSVFDLKEPADAFKNRMVDEGTSIRPCLLLHHPIPPNIVWKEPNYPPRKRVSAVRDFPDGCGRNVPRLAEPEDKHFGQSETDSKIHKEILLNDVNQNGEDPNAATAFRDMIQDVVPGERENTLEDLSESSEVKRKTDISEDNNNKQPEKEMEQLGYNRKDVRDVGNLLDGLNKEIVVYVKDKNKKKKSIAASSSNFELQEDHIAGVNNGKEAAVVQGLMCALNCPWRQGKGATKTIASEASIDRRKRKKPAYAGQDKHKHLPNKSKDNTEIMTEKTRMVIPEIDEVSRPLVLGDEEDSSENDECFQVLPRGRGFDVSLPPLGVCSSSEKGARSKVRETLRLFQGVLRKLLQGEETKSKDQENANKRIDLRVAKILKDHGKYINTEKVIGPVPGIEVGDIFNYRTELAVIGLHGPLQSGIDFIKLDKKSIATSIVASGGYDNDVDSSDVLIYTGQGGNAAGGDKQPEDQKLERGNLALKNSVDKKNLVRVIRGFKETKPAETPDGKPKMIATYTYDGLYTVEKYWQDLGPHGKLVYKFELRRIPGQPELAWKEVKQSKKFKAREGRCVDDISEGKETFPIGAVNTRDDNKPPPFTYITRMMYPDWCQPLPPRGCDCKDGCSDSEHCACAVKNGGEIPYNYGGAIVEAKPLVYECGPSCKCPPSCHNRVSQHGIKLPLEIFKTESRGWGVRCLSSIPSGSFICEYIGELLDDKEAEQRTGNDEYLFDIGQNYNDPTPWDGLSALMPDMQLSISDVVENVGFTIDAVRYGNIGRFINHSCSPNLYAQNVLYDHEDKRIPHIMLFAAENIPPLQELTYHYNYTIDQVYDSEGNIKKKTCYCGSSECTGRMY